MQVQVVENQADIAGKVREVAPHKELAAHHTIKIDVDSVADVASYPNLLGWAKGMAIEVTVPDAWLAKHALTPGARATMRVKKAGPTAVFVVPDPTTVP